MLRSRFHHTYQTESLKFIIINNKQSDPVDRPINFSVPQGSINGYVYFTCYSNTLGACVVSNAADNISGHADDHSTYASFNAGDQSAEINIICHLSSTL